MEQEIEEEVLVDSIYCPVDFSDINADDSYADKFIPSVIHVNPLGIKIFDDSLERIKYIRQSFAGQKIKCDVKYLDYEIVARKISYDGLTNEASLMVNGAYDIEYGVLTKEFISMAVNHVHVEELPDDLVVRVSKKIPLSEISEGIDYNRLFEEAGIVNEALSAALQQRKQEVENDFGTVNVGRGQAMGSTDAVYEYLRSYLTSPRFDQSQVPLLLGPTGVFKSATVKQICEDSNMRLVDFRVAFTGRLDYTGLIRKITDPIDGLNYSSACPMQELTTVSVGFLKYIELSYAKAKKVLDDGYQLVPASSDGVTKNSTEMVDLNSQQISTLKTFLENLSEFVKSDGTAKTPVLFFDEITRLKDENVEGVLTTILNQKKFNDLDFSMCKFVAASNSALGAAEELTWIYDAKEEVDAAYARRFIPLQVHPGDVMGRWFEWAEGNKKDKEYDVDGNVISSVVSGNTNIHKMVFNYLKENTVEVYNQSGPIEAFQKDGGDVGEARLVTFPNYRTWTMVSDYLYNIDKDSEPSFIRDTITGLIGKSSGDYFCSYLIGQGYKEVTEIKDPSTGEPLDDMSRFLQECAKSGTPGLLVGPSSMGKTSRIKNFCKRNGENYELITIVLSALSREDLMGFPAMEGVTEFASKEVNLIKSGLGNLKSELDGVIKDLNNPDSDIFDPTSRINSFMTSKVPSIDIKQKFVRAYKEGKTIVLFFDECNRNTNPAIMSSMFEAVSDHRLFGINFDPSRVIIFGAMNYKTGVYSGAKQIDAALAARFSVFRKDDFEESDVDSYIQYMKGEACPDNKENMNNMIIDFLENKINNEGKGSVVEWFRQVEQKSLVTGVPAPRAFSNLSAEIASMANSLSFSGKVIFDTPSIKTKMGRFIESDISSSDSSYFRTQYDFCRGVMEDLKGDLSKWNALKADVQIDVGGGKFLSSSKLVNDFNLIYQEVFAGKSWDGSIEDDWVSVRNWIKSIIQNMEECDKKSRNNRESIFSYFLGENVASEFTEFFNNKFGGTDFTITIEMLTDITLIKDFYGQKLSVGNTTTEQMISIIVNLIKEFEEVHKDSLSQDHYWEFLNRGIESLATADNVQQLFFRLGSEGLDNFVYKAEGTNSDIVTRLLSNMGINHVSKDAIERVMGDISGSLSGMSSGVSSNSPRFL